MTTLIWCSPPSRPVAFYFPPPRVLTVHLVAVKRHVDDNGRSKALGRTWAPHSCCSVAVSGLQALVPR
jgi:hypothetical protein